MRRVGYPLGDSAAIAQDFLMDGRTLKSLRARSRLAVQPGQYYPFGLSTRFVLAILPTLALGMPYP